MFHKLKFLIVSILTDTLQVGKVTSVHPPSLNHYLDAVLIEEAWQREPFLFVQGLTEDDKLLKQEDPPLLHPTEQTTVGVGHHECVLQQKAALSHNLPLEAKREKC